MVRVMRAVRDAALRTRLGLVTWQEIAALLPARVQRFLEEKYGIEPVSSTGQRLPDEFMSPASLAGLIRAIGRVSA